jgi:hypothetical protein
MPHQSKMYALMQDCEKTLDPEITDLFEREANVFASEALFQGEVFAEQAHDREFGIKTAMALAKQFGASNYATFRRYVFTNPRACCLVVLKPPLMVVGGGFRRPRSPRFAVVAPTRILDLLPQPDGSVSSSLWALRGG